MITKRIFDLITDNQSHFRADFTDWLSDNPHVYHAFADAAFKVWRAGWKHYSARTIVEVIRHRSKVREINGDYKINNNRVPDLARLYMLMHPEQAGLFEFRSSELRAA